MKKKNFIIAVCLLTAFALWTALVRFVDVKAIGPEGSSVGFSMLNGYFHTLTGTNTFLYNLTDWLGLVPIAAAFVFAVLGLTQWIKRKSLLKVDIDILLLGGFYLAVMAVYLLFEFVVINCRPVLIDGYLEASYPSSTTMLVLCVMPTAAMQLNKRIKKQTVKLCVIIAITAFTVFMIVGRIFSGVHWITDIIGGSLLSSGLVMMYSAFFISE